MNNNRMADSKLLAAPMDKTAEVTGGPTNLVMQTSELGLRDVISIPELSRIRDLGLGRGVDATNPNIWARKSPFVMMHICPKLSNIIGTEEGGMRQYFTEEVSCLTSHQTGIGLSLTEPSSQVKVGIDADYSRSKSSTRKTVGAKVHTRTVSFRADLDGLPIYSLNKKAGLGLLKSPKPQLKDGHPESFETQFSRWVLHRIEAKFGERSSSESARNGESKPTPLEREAPVEQLSWYLESLKPELESAVVSYCKEMVNDLGVTHYVNSIELGAMKYQIFTMGVYQQKFGVGGSVGVDQIAKATVSGKYENKKMNKSTKIREIGKITDNKEVKRNSSEEAVIGFTIQPIHKLVRHHCLQAGLHKAITEYIERKSDKSEGPFLISCMVDDTQVYWTVNEQYQLAGTPNVQRASPLHVIPTEQNHPSEFFVAYYGESKDARKQPRSLCDPMIKCSNQAPLSRYLTSNANMFGFSSQPLKFISSATVESTHFSLNKKIITSTLMCFSTTVSPDSWIEGDEFFINCSRGVLQIGGYLAMKRELIPVKHGQLDSIYTSVILPTISSEQKNKGMLFRLHPAEYREMQASQEPEPASESNIGHILEPEGAF